MEYSNKIAIHYLLDIFFLDKNTGWVTGWINNGINYGSVIYKTTNSGINWYYNLFPDTSLYVTTICFLDNYKGVLGATSNTKTLFYTTNGGNNWHICNTDSTFYSNFPVRKINFLNQLTGFAIGGYFDISGVIWKTVNGGFSWYSQPIGNEPFNDIIFIDSNKYIIAGGDYEYGISVTTTTNAGMIWNYTQLNEFGIGYGISFRKKTEGYIASGYAKKILKSTDFGITWVSINTPDNAAIYDIKFYNEKFGWCIGDSGVIYKFNYNYSSVNNLTQTVNNIIITSFNFPNPFNSTSAIKFQLSEDCNVNIIIYDVNGKEVKVFETRKYFTGENIVNLRLKGFPSGIYFYKLHGISLGSRKISINTGKMVIIN